MPSALFRSHRVSRTFTALQSISATPVAAIALLGVVEATQTGIGGDCFVLYMRRGEGEIIALNGSGWAPAAASLDRYVSRGMRWIPSDSADAVTVPGAVASWARLIDDHGTMKLAHLLQPAIA